MGNGAFKIRSPLEYESQLVEHFVMANRMNRRRTIWSALRSKAESLGGTITENDSLLDEVTALVEWPIILAGHFNERFLRVPSEVLISAMREHQRYFHLVDDAGSLLPIFLTVANVDSPEPEVVIKGNERVITPRLADAEFFYDKDLKQAPIQWLESLKMVTYQAELGSYFEKERLGSLSSKSPGVWASMKPQRSARVNSLKPTWSEWWVNSRSSGGHGGCSHGPLAKRARCPGDSRTLPAKICRRCATDG